jgi:hypothetical protein
VLEVDNLCAALQDMYHQLRSDLVLGFTPELDD